MTAGLYFLCALPCGTLPLIIGIVGMWRGVVYMYPLGLPPFRAPTANPEMYHLRGNAGYALSVTYALVGLIYFTSAGFTAIQWPTDMWIVTMSGIPFSVLVFCVGASVAVILSYLENRNQSETQDEPK